MGDQTSFGEKKKYIAYTHIQTHIWIIEKYRYLETKNIRMTHLFKILEHELKCIRSKAKYEHRRDLRIIFVFIYPQFTFEF